MPHPEHARELLNATLVCERWVGTKKPIAS